jgi:hypothetical protein
MEEAMIAFGRLSAIVLLVLILGVATTAWAGTAQYYGTLIIDGFGNDTNTVPPPDNYPFSTNVFLGHPFGITCNPYYGPNTKVCGGTDQSAQDGMPLVGLGTATSVTGTSPAAFKLPQSDLARKLGTPATVFHPYTPKQPKRPVRCWQTSTPGCGVPGGSFSAYFPYIYSYTYADLKNAAGSFFGGGGPGNFSYPYKVGGNTVARMVVKQGANRFGGTMKLLGQFYSIGAYYRYGQSIGAFGWLFDRVGGGGYYSGTVLTYPKTTRTSFTLKHTVLKQTLTSTAIANYVGWTTGTATVTATKRGPFPSVMQRKGYDYRTSKGLVGTIQLVSPLLTLWRSPAANTESASIGMMKLVFFVPEPAKGMMLLAGVSLLGLFYRVHRRSS